MSQLEIQSALAQRLETVAGIPTIYWGSTFKTPEKGTDFVRPTVVPIESTQFSLDGTQDNSGVYSVGVFIDLGQGEGPLLTLMDAIKDHFFLQTLTEGSTKVEIQAISMSQMTIVDAWLTGNVTIKYFAVNNGE